jgi:hypothetical protein
VLKKVVIFAFAVLFYLSANASAVLSDTTDDGTGTISARGENLPSEGMAKAFDNSTATKWLDFTTTTSWIQYQYASSKQSVVTEYTLTSANDFQERDPTNFNLQGSNNGGASWVTLDTRTGVLFTARFQKLSFSFTNSNTAQTAEYKSYAAGINPLIPIYTVPGNHDISEPSSSTRYTWWLSNLAYPTGLTNPWYSFTYNDSIFICLDSGVFRADRGGKQAAEIAWLTQTLADANTAGYTHKFVFMHISLCLNSINEAYMGSTGFNLPLAIRATLLSLFHHYGVKVVMAGHRHTNNDAVDGDLQMFTTTSPAHADWACHQHRRVFAFSRFILTMLNRKSAPSIAFHNNYRNNKNTIVIFI